MLQPIARKASWMSSRRSYRTQAPMLVQPGDRPLDDPPLAAEA
jgi:hypothetical protein